MFCCWLSGFTLRETLVWASRGHTEKDGDEVSETRPGQCATGKEKEPSGLKTVESTLSQWVGVQRMARGGGPISYDVWPYPGGGVETDSMAMSQLLESLGWDERLGYGDREAEATTKGQKGDGWVMEQRAWKGGMKRCWRRQP